jgi:RHS repeat-associated protein
MRSKLTGSNTYEEAHLRSSPMRSSASCSPHKLINPTLPILVSLIDRTLVPPYRRMILSQPFDPNGNLLTQTDTTGTTTYTWDARNRLVAISGPTLSAAFAYDAVGRRISKTVSGVTTTFLYDGLDAIGEYGGAGEAAYLRTLTIDEALTRTDATGPVAYLTDILGSTLALADPSGGLPTTYTYAPFGETTVTGLPSPNSFQFTGRENDGSGLLYYRARYHDAIRHRFLSQDPIGFLGGDKNLYAFLANDPVGSVDSLGLWKSPAHTRFTAGPMIVSGAFGQAEIDRVVRVNVNMDRLANQFNDPAHYMPRNQAAAEALISNSLERAIQLARSGRLEAAMEALGEGLHTVQDRYSHFEQNAGWLGHPGCDDPTRHPREFDAALDTSRRYIDRFLLGIGIGR